MKISFAWLRELVALPASCTVEEVAGALTLAGLEIEGLHRRGAGLAGVRIVEVVSMRPHPGADKLRLVTVDAGGTREEIVCGAPNVPAAGGKVVWAPPGATLPGGLTLARRDVRGVSSPGMLCSEVELGLAAQADGLLLLAGDAPTGGDFLAYAGLPDTVLEVNVTANRPDALSHVGVAREVSALFGVPWQRPAVATREVKRVAGTAGQGSVNVSIADGRLCPRYQATVLEGLSVAASPLALRLRLEACGVRAISNLVDVTNFVMLEAGHPLHAFDADKVEGGIEVRLARAGETLVTLDGVERKLEPTDLVIADAHKPLALAGVMGGASSEVTPATKRVLLEAATFHPATIRKTAKRLGLSSEASYRFERGVDPNGLDFATARAVDALLASGGGRVVGATLDVYVTPPAAKRVQLSLASLDRLAGSSVCTAEEAAARLGAIGVATVVERTSTGPQLVAEIPSFRPDLGIEQDLAEEVLRLVGYQAIPVRLPAGGKAPAASPEALADAARDALAAAGLHEVALWAFVPAAWQRALSPEPRDVGLRLRNPISADYEIMRTTLLPGLVDSARRNVARGLTDVAIFEVGPVVLAEAGAEADAKTGETLQPTVAGGLLTGHTAGWLKPGAPLDYFDVKGVVESLCAALGVEARYEPWGAEVPPFLHPGLSARVRLSDGRSLGWLGELDPRYRKRMDLDVAALAFELDLSALGSTRPALRSVSPPRFPSVSRDISFWIDVDVTSDRQRAAFRAAEQPLLRELAVCEDFRDPKYAPAGKKGMLWSLTYRADDRTLTDAEVDAAHAKVLEALKKQFAVAVR
jgi:phenylalanyl-tRNA synthetase beta chain